MSFNEFLLLLLQANVVMRDFHVICKLAISVVRKM